MRTNHPECEMAKRTPARKHLPDVRIPKRDRNKTGATRTESWLAERSKLIKEFHGNSINPDETRARVIEFYLKLISGVKIRDPRAWEKLTDRLLYAMQDLRENEGSFLLPVIMSARHKYHDILLRRKGGKYAEMTDDLVSHLADRMQIAEQGLLK
jgi:hypothetical protein